MTWILSLGIHPVNFFSVLIFRGSRSSSQRPGQTDKKLFFFLFLPTASPRKPSRIFFDISERFRVVLLLASPTFFFGRI